MGRDLYGKWKSRDLDGMVIGLVGVWMVSG